MLQAAETPIRAQRPANADSPAAAGDGPFQGTCGEPALEQFAADLEMRRVGYLEFSAPDPSRSFKILPYPAQALGKLTAPGRTEWNDLLVKRKIDRRTERMIAEQTR